MLFIESATGRRIGFSMRNRTAAQIQEFAQAIAPRLAQRWGTDVTVSYEPETEQETSEQSPNVNFSLGNLPENQEG